MGAGRLKARRVKQQIQRLIPQWKNPSAGKSVYLFLGGAFFMFLSFAAPFWEISDVAEGDTIFKLDIIGGLTCSDYTLADEGLWPDDLPVVKNNIKTDKVMNDEYLMCKYYQFGNAGLIAGCTFLAMVGSLICCGYAYKAAMKPSKIDLKLTKIFGGFGFLCFLLGLQAVALFTPGTRGDKADLKGGFILQVIGLCFVLGGVITIVDAGQKDMILPALNFSNFGGAAAAPTNKKVAPTPVPL